MVGSLRLQNFHKIRSFKLNESQSRLEPNSPIIHTANFSVVIFTTASHDNILRCSPDVEFTSGSPTQLRDVIWIKYICTTTEEM